MENFKIFLTYFLGTLGFAVLVLLNYFNEEVLTIFPFLPALSVPVFSLFLSVLIGYILWQKAMMAENMKYQFLTIATHKFRTPITAIKWITESLKKEVTREEKLNYLKQVEISIGRLLEVVDILTGLAKFSGNLEYAFEVSWPREMIDVSLDKYAKQAEDKGIVFDITTDHEVPLVIIDKRKIQFVVDTLFENAIKYSKPGGHIKIHLSKENNFVVISVADEGVGIERGEVGKMFRRFWRSAEARSADPEGMGLSLYMVKEIMERHGGKIWVESEGRDKGAIFFIKLKISTERP